MIRLFCILSIFSFLSASHFDFQETEARSAITASFDTANEVAEFSIEGDHCDDCQNDGCSDVEDCCKGLCSCVSTFLNGESFEISEVISKPLSKSRWYYFSHYRLPFLDPALKPPLFA